MPDIENALTRISSIQQYFPAINQGLEDAYAASITAGDTLADVQERIPEINNQIQDYQNQVDNAQDTLDEAEQVTDEVTELVHSRINDAGEIINGLPSFDFNTEESVTPDFVNNVKDSVGDSQGNLEEMLEELRNSDSLESNESLEKLSSSADGTVEQGNDLSAELEDMLTQIEADNFTEEDINTLNEAIADYQSSFDEVKEDLANAEFIPDTSQGEENSDNVEEDTEQDSEENNDNAEEDTEQGNEDAEQSEDPKETPQRDEEIDQVINELHDDTMQAFDEISNVLDQNIDLAKVIFSNYLNSLP